MEEGRRYTREAVEYISKLSEGGLRDAITMLDKCLSYSKDLTVANVVKALGVADYYLMEQLTLSMIDDDAINIIKIIEQIHSDGLDLKQFIRQYLNFILDVKKWIILQDFEYINLPQTIDIESLLKTVKDEYNKINDILDLLIRINAEIKYDSSPKYLIEAYLTGGIEW